MFDDALIAQLAQELESAELLCTQLEHFSKRYPGMTMEDGYRINRAWAACKKVKGHPAVGSAWLSNELAPWGEHLAAAEIVLAGSFTKPVPAKAGDTFDVDYGAHGRLQFKFI